MFKVHDIVGVPDGRTGMVHKVKGQTITVRFGSMGPYERFQKRLLRFVGGGERADEMEASGGVNFFKKQFIGNRRKRVRGS